MAGSRFHRYRFFRKDFLASLTGGPGCGVSPRLPMKHNVIILIKDREPGLLEIVQGRAKSLVPVSGGRRIIDYYLMPFLTAGGEITVLAGKNGTGIKDYIVYSYSSGTIKVLEKEPLEGLLDAVGGGEGTFVVHADGLLRMEYGELESRMEAFTGRCCGLLVNGALPIGFFIREAGILRDIHPGEGVDGLWEGIVQTLGPENETISLPFGFIGLRTVVEYYRAHFDVLRKTPVEWHAPFTSGEGGEEAVSRIAPEGYVKSSLIGHSCSVNGVVDNSIIFSNVRVGRGARVTNSIVMSHNYIGDDAVIQNAIVCDSAELFNRVSPNIGEGSRIGEDDRSGANVRWPDWLHDGITLIGRNVDIPKGFRVHRNCYIQSGTDRAALREKGDMPAGDSAFFSI